MKGIADAVFVRSSLSAAAGITSKDKRPDAADDADAKIQVTSNFAHRVTKSGNIKKDGRVFIGKCDKKDVKSSANYSRL